MNIFLFIFWNILNLIDLILTIYGLSLGHTELNPIMSYFFNYSMTFTIFFKLAIPNYFIYKAKNHKWINHILIGLSIIYIVVVISNIRMLVL